MTSPTSDPVHQSVSPVLHQGVVVSVSLVGRARILRLETLERRLEMFMQMPLPQALPTGTAHHQR